MYGWQPEDYPNASYIGLHTISLPISAKLTDADLEDVIAGVKKCLALGKTKNPVLAAATPG
jgi:dTDP-4-amino-4,6-dideoxygalactose transaminase